MRRLFWLVCGVSWLGSCGSTRSDETTDACAEAASLYCSRFETCSKFWFAALWDSQVACNAEYADRCREEIAAEGSGLRAAQIMECAEATSANCELMILSAAAQGSSVPYGGLAYQPKQCRPPAGELPLGAACRFDSQCSSRLCAYEDGCVRCVEGLPKGAPCSNPAGNARCAADLVCSVECIEPAFEGEPCGGFNIECEGPLACVNETCTLQDFIGAPGDSCPMLGDYCSPVLGLVCAGQTDPRCTQLVLAGEGENCGGMVSCRAGFICDSSVCVPHDRSCTTTADCDEGICNRRLCTGGSVPNVCP